MIHYSLLIISRERAKKIPTTRVGRREETKLGELRSVLITAKSVPILFSLTINWLVF
jgi:hypothetical protein